VELSIKLSSAYNPTLQEEVQQLFKYAEEMRLDENFARVDAHYSSGKAQIIFEASYKPVFADDDSNNMCLLTIVLEVKEKDLYGRFRIWDPTRKVDIVYSKALLPYEEFVSLVTKTQDIGALHPTSRGAWYQRPEWEYLRASVGHG